MRYATTSAAAITLASTLLSQLPAEVAGFPAPEAFDKRYADNAGIIDGLVATHPNLAIRQAPAPPANLPNATGLSYAVPPPNSNGGKAWKEAHGRARSLVDQMTVTEKVSVFCQESVVMLCSWHVPFRSTCLMRGRRHQGT